MFSEFHLSEFVRRYLMGHFWQNRSKVTKSKIKKKVQECTLFRKRHNNKLRLLSTATKVEPMKKCALLHFFFISTCKEVAQKNVKVSKICQMSKMPQKNFKCQKCPNVPKMSPEIPENQKSPWRDLKWIFWSTLSLIVSVKQIPFEIIHMLITPPRPYLCCQKFFLVEVIN